MARIIVELDSTTITKIRAILEKRSYESIEEFVWVSVANQLHLESTSKSKVEWASASLGRLPIEEVCGDPLAILTVGSSEGDIEVLDVTPTTEPLWGMYYRYLPLKIAVRCIANVGRRPTSETLPRIGNSALILGERIREYEKRKEIKRGYGNSQGLPGRRKDVEASINRFLSLYVGTALKKTGKVSGMMRDVGFGTIKDGHMPFLSKDGLQFARLKNPVIDENRLDLPLSEEEKQFLLDHIKSKMPGEYDFMKAYYRALCNGAKSPSDIAVQTNAYLREKLSGEAPTDSVLATMTSGVQSRMVEVGLVAFQRVGTSSRYELTEFGKVSFKGDLE